MKKLEYKPYQIIKKSEIAPDTILFTIGGNLNFASGQFVQIAVDHIGEATFAPCSDPEQKGHFDICVRSAGNLSSHLAELLPGDFINMRGPYGNGWPLMKMIGHNVMIIAGGMGMVPMRPLLSDLTHNKSEFRKTYLVGGFKTNDHVLFAEDLLALKKNFAEMIICAEHTSGDSWVEKGMITESVEKINITDKNTIALICGPEIMYPECIKILTEKGIAEKNIYLSYERRMECGIGACQHCNIGKYLVCKNGPVFSWDRIKTELGK